MDKINIFLEHEVPSGLLRMFRSLDLEPFLLILDELEFRTYLLLVICPCIGYYYQI